jgi:hypothetical protein
LRTHAEAEPDPLQDARKHADHESGDNGTTIDRRRVPAQAALPRPAGEGIRPGSRIVAHHPRGRIVVVQGRSSSGDMRSDSGVERGVSEYIGAMVSHR